MEDALHEAEQFISNKEYAGTAERVDRVGRLIDGFQSPYSMELLASVHWVATHDDHVSNVDEAIAAIHRWNPRKQELMKPNHILAAWSRLQSDGWLSGH